ncbi:MAG: DUF2892 domain-containing protein [Brevundimonas sp.]|uniref:YgaP-like transmembrane domain n=1 Tax=Brevundimonas sp. TaxID=1871086 RepID=UPI002734EFFA|nr:YgaP-like transmembrane domain [Brevundimonas sp.]MBX9615760.1 DUF2892 domain-containing protein [Caulobacteraceae bacterium]MDP3404248.1 DUF2892 domain-containing protein [Brevundimonas sp.]
MKNVGTLDRIVRAAAVIAIAAAYGLGLIGGTLAIVLGVVAVVLLLTSLTSTCPAYMPFGLSTRGKAR